MSNHPDTSRCRASETAFWGREKPRGGSVVNDAKKHFLDAIVGQIGRLS